MELPTGQVPGSYQIYLDQFDSDPDGTLQKLENHVSKRNSGAVGYYFLAVLSRKAGKNADALKFALSARILAPGSTFFKRLPYFIQHPDLFQAWVPRQKPAVPGNNPMKTDSTHPIRDLDLLITKLSEADKKRIKIPENKKEIEDHRDLSKSSANVDDIVTETLALIHEKQGNFEASIKVYKQLRLANSAKRDHYDKQIIRLNELIENQRS